MEKPNLGSYKEQFKKNKLELIKIKKGRVVGLELIENLKLNPNTEINIQVIFNDIDSVQKTVFNQGILLPYKFSKDIEKVKFYLFNLRDSKLIKKSDFNYQLTMLNEAVCYQIREIIEKQISK